MRGADTLLGALDGATAMPCSGRCDDPVPVLRGSGTIECTRSEASTSLWSPTSS